MVKPNTSDSFTYEALAAHLSCFYDVPIMYLHRSSGLSVKSIIKAREMHGGGDMDTWPFVTIKQGINAQHSWLSVMEERKRVMARTTDQHVLAMLQKTARKAEQLRLICHTPNEQMLLRQGEDGKPLPRPSLSTAETEVALLNMIDLPLKTVEQLLRISLHSIFNIRVPIGLQKWPYERLCSGRYQRSMEEVAQARAEVLACLQEGTGLRVMLEDAAAVAETQTLHPKYSYSKLVHEDEPDEGSPVDQPEEAEPLPVEQPEEAEPTHAKDEPHDPHGSQGLFDTDEPLPAPASVEEGAWDDDDQGFWGTNTDLSPASREYWDGLAEISRDAFT
jgi:hypothetical protein